MVAIYARQSVDKKDSISIETQIEKCKAEAGEDVKIFVDKGFSGKNTKRPEFQKMMEQVRVGEVEKIVVYRIDRFSRSIADFGAVWDVLQTYGVEFVSINEKFDTATPIGRAMLYIVMSFAQLERETIAERIKDNYYARLQNGTWVGGPAPFGFSIQRENHQGKKVSLLQANEEIEVVKKIYDMYGKEGTSLGSVVNHLTKQGIPCRKRKAWDTVAVSRILHNPIYAKCDFDIYVYLLTKGIQIKSLPEEFDGIQAGMLVGKRDRGGEKYRQKEHQSFAISLHKGVVDSILWLSCNEKLDKNQQILNTGKGKYTWLSGLLKCGSCGYSLKVIFSKEKKYLICSGRTNYHICKKKISISIEELEKEVEKELVKIFSDFEVKENFFHEDGMNFAEKILEVEKKISRLVEAIAESDDIPVRYLNEKIQKLQKEKDGMLQRNKTEKTIAMNNRFDFISLNFQEKKMVANEVIEKILIEDENVEIRWNV